jgi:hypothetical protein
MWRIGLDRRDCSDCPTRVRASQFSLPAGKQREDFFNSGTIPSKINSLWVNLRGVAGNFLSLPSAWQGTGRETQDKNDIIDSPVCF